MAGIIKEDLDLISIVKHEVDLYVGDAYEARIYGIVDDNQQIYAAIFVPEKKENHHGCWSWHK